MQKIFTQVRNEEKDILAIAHGYQNKINHELWLADGLQKDAIQNSWDARIDKKHGKNWECGFSLFNIGKSQVLMISDQGTHGLNGDFFNTHDELSKILLSQKTGEDLAYFLNSNWSTKTSEEGGNRGRGKTLFLAASKDRRIIFDSFRLSDNAYVCGTLYLDQDKQVKFVIHYGNEAKDFFQKITNGELQALKNPGTRVLVVNPDDAVVKAIHTGEILSFISNSRWEIIKKFDAKIFVDDGKKKKLALLPTWYEEDLKDLPKEQVRIIPAENIKDKTIHRTKRLILRYAPDLNIPEYIKGIAIQRGGMTIERKLADELVHEEGMADIYGWIELDKELEADMKANCEGPEHFSFTWAANPAKYLNDYIRIKIREFAKDLKLIESEDGRRTKNQKAAEEKAAKKLTHLFKKLGLFGKRRNPGTRSSGTRKPDEPLRLSASQLSYPGEGKRVNYGEKINGTYVVPINELTTGLMVLVRVFIVSADGKSTMIAEKEINLDPGTADKIGLDSITITEKYKKGPYSFRARMIALESLSRPLINGAKVEKGTILYDRINSKFYVESDPPEPGGLKFEPRARKDDKNYLFEWEIDEEGRYTIYYNTEHPRIKTIKDNEQKLADYLGENGVLIAFQIKLEEVATEDDGSDNELSELIKSKNPSMALSLLLSKHSAYLWDTWEQ